MNSRFNLLALTLLGTATLAGTAAAQTVVTQWNFNADTGAPNTTPAPSTGAGTASTLGFNNSYTTPSSMDISDVFVTNGTADFGSSDASAANNIFRVRGGTSPATKGINGWNSAAPIGTQGAQFLTSTLGQQAVQVSFDWYVTTAGEGKLQVQYTTNGQTFVNVPASLFSAATYPSVQYDAAGANILTTNTTTLMTNPAAGGSANTVAGAFLQSAAQGWTNQITFNLSGITAANNNPNFGVRFVNAATGADDAPSTGTGMINNTSGNWRFDQVTISGTPIAGVPEPGTWALVGLGLLGPGALVRRQRARAV